MKRLIAFAALLLCFGIGSCQCSDKPDIGPVDGGQAVHRPASSSPASSPQA